MKNIKSFNDIYIADQIDQVEKEYLYGDLEQDDAISSLRKLWGQLGYSVDNSNAEIYLSSLKKIGG